MHTRRRATCAATLLAAFIAMPASATLLIPADLAAMAAGSDTIVHGTVLDVRSQTSTGSRSGIESVVTVAVAVALKGDPGGTIAFRVPGGRMGRYRRIMVGAPVFKAGDEVVLFLHGAAPALPTPFGLSQGVYRVTRSGGSALVAPLIDDVPGRIVRGDPARRPLPLDTFARRVRAAATGR